jgi:hypothetical protein
MISFDSILEPLVKLFKFRIIMSTGCQDPNFCRGGCCRDFFGTQFCDVESNCVAAPTWIILLVPIMLGLTAVVLLIIVCVRLHNRKVI